MVPCFGRGADLIVLLCTNYNIMADHNVGFLGGRIPREVVSMAKHLKDLDKQLFRQILKGELTSKAL